VNLTPTEAAQDVVDNALSVLEQGLDLSHISETSGLTEIGEDEDGRMYFSVSGGLPVVIDCDEEGARVQWSGTTADGCFDEFVALFSAYDGDMRRNVESQGGHYSGTIRIGGRAYVFNLFDDQVAIGSDPNELSEGTVLTLADEEGAWMDSWSTSRRAKG